MAGIHQTAKSIILGLMLILFSTLSANNAVAGDSAQKKEDKATLSDATTKSWTDRLKFWDIKLLKADPVSPKPSRYNAEDLTSMEKAVEAAISTNPDVIESYKKFEAAVKEKDAAWGGYLPKVDLSLSAGYEDRDDPITRAPTATVKSKFGRNQGTVSLRQMLFDGFFTKTEVERLDRTSRARLFELEEVSQATARDASRAYIDLIRYRTLTQLTEDNYVNHKVIYEQLELKAKAGVGKKSDVQQAKSRLSLADYNMSVEGSNLHDIESRYQRLTGTIPPKNTSFSSPTQHSEIPSNAADAVKYAQLHNPALLATIEDTLSQTALYENRKSGFMPHVDFRARADRGNDLNGYMGSHSNNVAEVVMTWNLFNGNTDSNLREKEYALLDAANNRRDKFCRDIRLELDIAYNDIRKLKEQSNYLDSRVISIEKARDAYRKQFEIGQRTLIDLLNAENELFEAKRLYTNVNMDLAYAYVRAHYRMGTLLNALHIERYGSLFAALPNDASEVGAKLEACPAETVAAYVPDRKTLDARASEVLTPMTISNEETQKAPIEEAVAPAQHLELPKNELVASDNKKQTSPKNEPKNPKSPSPSSIPDNLAVQQRVDAWANAWRSRNLNEYLGFYSNQFKPENQSRAAWIASRTKRLSSSENIELKLDNVSIEVKDSHATASFTQSYRSKTYQDEAKKILSFNRENGLWMIVREQALSDVNREIANKPIATPTPSTNLEDDAAGESELVEPPIEVIAAPIAPKPVVKPIEPHQPGVWEKIKNYFAELMQKIKHWFQSIQHSTYKSTESAQKKDVLAESSNVHSMSQTPSLWEKTKNWLQFNKKATTSVKPTSTPRNTLEDDAAKTNQVTLEPALSLESDVAAKTSTPASEAVTEIVTVPTTTEPTISPKTNKPSLWEKTKRWLHLNKKVDNPLEPSQPSQDATRSDAAGTISPSESPSQTPPTKPAFWEKIKTWLHR